jgi:hypothetical protein
MDWANERYVRIYTRDTADDQVLSWQARALWPLLVRKADHGGVIATSHGPRGISALVQWPMDAVTSAMAELVTDGRIRECHEPRGYVLPNYVAAQTTPSSPKLRKAEERERRRDVANNSVTKRDEESRNVTESHAASRGVTRGHAESHGVTPSLAKPSLAKPNEEDAAPPAPLVLSDSAGLVVVKRKVDAATGPHNQAIAEFTAYYQRAHGGASPTWNGRSAKQMSELVKAHGLAEVTRRIGVLETAPPKWPLAPWDFPTFHTHIDKLASASAGTESALDVALRIAGGSQ